MRNDANNKGAVGRRILMDFAGKVRKKENGIMTNEWIEYGLHEPGLIVSVRRSGLSYVYLIRLDKGGEFEVRRHHFAFDKRR